MTLPTRARVEEDHFEAIYLQYFDLLVQIAAVKFQVPESEAETLAHDVLLGYLLRADDVVALRRWLIGAICHASRHYWRLNGRTITADAEIERDRADPASLRILDSLPDQLAAREALECLAPRCRAVLHMRYFEGCTVAEVAGRLGVKTRRAEKLIARCLRNAERLYGEKGKRKG